MEDAIEHTSLLGEKIVNKFRNVSSIGGIDVDLKLVRGGYNNEFEIDWNYKGVSFHGNFYYDKSGRECFCYGIRFNRDKTIEKRLESLLSENWENTPHLEKPFEHSLIYEDDEKKSHYTIKFRLKYNPNSKREISDILNDIMRRVILPTIGISAKVI
ncbi:MAG: hypothetical protein QXW97_02720 [Candidatus Pacearchaeota archaeon]